MISKTVIAWAVAVLLVSQGAGSRLMGADETGDKSAKVLAVLPNSKHTLADGIKQASARSPEVAISAKFELDGDRLSLSVYTVEKGLGADAEHNVLKELAGSPEGGKWSPEVEVFKDVPHVSRASQQLTLMSLTQVSLLDVIKKAEKDHPGTVFSITPVLHDHKGECVVLVGTGGKVAEFRYDLMTDEPLPKK
jgi:hypothetical protein